MLLLGVFFWGGLYAVAGLASGNSAKPTLAAGSPVVNAFSYQPALAPGEIVSIFGAELAECTASADTLPLHTSLCGSTVTFNGQTAFLFYASSSQINAEVPGSLMPHQDVTVIVTRSGVSSDNLTIPAAQVGEVAPAFAGFSPDGKSSYVVIQNPDGWIAGPWQLQPAMRPLKIGEIGTTYATGLGPTSPLVPDGQAAPASPLAMTSLAVEVYINGFSEPVLYSGLTPGLSGLYQVNFKVDPKTPITTNNLAWLKVKGVESPHLRVSVTGAAYVSPSCGPKGGSTPWACQAWPSITAPTLGAAGTATTDPDTGARVVRATESASFGEAADTAFKVFDAGWKQAWNADNTRFLVLPWSKGSVANPAYWMEFNPAAGTLTGQHAAVPGSLSEFEWDATDPDLLVGMAGGVAKSYNVKTKVWATIFDPWTSGWGAQAWSSTWSGARVCIAEGPQDSGHRIVCFNRQTSTWQVVDLRFQRLNGMPLPVSFQGSAAALPATVGVHAITLAPDGRWLAIDTHGNAMCSTPGLSQYASTGMFLDLDGGRGYEWNVSCGETHWAYGYGGVLMQSTTPKWTPTGNLGPCNSDSRGVARRTTDATIDSSFAILQPCRVFNSATWNVNVHLSWTNNTPGPPANKVPVVMATVADAAGTGLLWNEIAASETTSRAYGGQVWRLAQTWNDPVGTQCGFLDYSSPSVSRDGRWALFPSDWQGQTGSNGVCFNGTRTDVFVFELK